ncbi:MAG: hypothetical protein Aurels2KO_55970 [Aureliella sp.]
MSRRPEIGNVRLYPDRPLNKSDRNGYVLKFYCPVRRARIRRNCGTRDRREARRILRECRERLLNGEYEKTGGAISEKHLAEPRRVVIGAESGGSKSWDECYESYRSHKIKRSSKDSFQHARSRLAIAERIFQGYFEDRGIQSGIAVKEVMTLAMLEYLQERLLEGDECRYDKRSPNTVNSMLGAVMAFVRFCAKREWIDRIPVVEPLDVDDVMKGRPVTGEEFERMLAATGKVVGEAETASWHFALKVLWFSGFRIGDLMDFHWDDERHIRPTWPSESDMLPTISVPSSQKNGKLQEIPMLPELEGFLRAVPEDSREGWIVNPSPIYSPIKPYEEWFQPADKDLISLAHKHSNLAIAAACGVTETTIRNWLKRIDGQPVERQIVSSLVVEKRTVAELKSRAVRKTGAKATRTRRMTKEHVGRIIARIGKAAGVVVRRDDERTGSRVKYASAHDIRRGCAQRLINAGVSAETLKVVMRHADFATTEKYYGAMRSAQAAATEVRKKLTPDTADNPLVGGLMGGHKKTPQLNAEELLKLKCLLERL